MLYSVETSISFCDVRAECKPIAIGDVLEDMGLDPLPEIPTIKTNKKED